MKYTAKIKVTFNCTAEVEAANEDMALEMFNRAQWDALESQEITDWDEPTQLTEAE